MAKTPSELVIAGNGSVYAAPVGTTLPTTPTASLAAAFIDLGYTDEDGVTLKQTRQVKDYFAWQSKDPLRRELLSREIMLSFKMEQWNGENLAFAFGGGAVTNPSAGIFRYEFPAASDTIDERTLIVDWNDGSSRHYRLVIARGNVSEDVETSLTKSDLSVLPVGWKALAPTSGVIAYILTDDTQFTIIT